MPSRKQTKRTGKGVVIDCLNEFETKYIFGHTGAAVIPLHVEMNERMSRNEVVPRFLLFRQEGGAGHAAEGYARVTGKPGVVLVTSGPGSTNCVTPVADAYKDSTPCVFITGQVAANLIGNDSFQEVDTVGITRPISKHNYLIKDIKNLERKLKEAFFVASSGRPGPVVVDICRNVLTSETDNSHRDYKPLHYNPKIKMNTRSADTLIESLVKAERPVVKAGGGIISSESSYALREFIEKYQIPVVTTFMALGSVRSDDPKNMGMPGMHGTYAANKALEESDFILTLGGRFDDRVAVSGFSDGKKIAHVDIEDNEINKTIVADYPLPADVKDFLRHALMKEDSTIYRNNWLSRLKEMKKQNGLYENSDEIIKPQYVIEQLSALTHGDATIVTGVGQHQMWAAQYYQFTRPRQWVSSGGLGTMGFGFPAAIGAYLGNPDKPVVCIEGDGSFQMNMQELGTINAYRLPIKTFIFNNGYLGMVRQWEDLFFSGNHYETCMRRTFECASDCNIHVCSKEGVNFEGISHMYKNIRTLTLTKPSEISACIQEVLESPYPYVVDVHINNMENVYPMIPAGKGFEGMIIEK
jgi:acetolactate synthase I/II/III large subunit